MPAYQVLMPARQVGETNEAYNLRVNTEEGINGIYAASDALARENKQKQEATVPVVNEIGQVVGTTGVTGSLTGGDLPVVRVFEGAKTVVEENFPIVFLVGAFLFFLILKK